MKAKILSVLAQLSIEVLTYSMKNEDCKTLNELATKLSKRYVKDDVERIKGDLEFVYESDNKDCSATGNTLGLTKETLVNILSTATYGSDWLTILRPKKYDNLLKEESECREEKWADILLGGGYIVAFAYDGDDEPTRHEVTLDKMKKGLDVLQKDYPKDYADLVTENDDYYTGSNLMQCVLFGEVIYG